MLCTICLEHCTYHNPEDDTVLVEAAVTIQEGQAVCAKHLIDFANWDRRLALHS